MAGRALYVSPASATSVVTDDVTESFSRTEVAERPVAANFHRVLTRGAGPVIAEDAKVPRDGGGGGGAGFLVVGEMSRSGRGMHTTTTVTLIQLQGGGLLADTPGERRGDGAGGGRGRGWVGACGGAIFFNPRACHSFIYCPS